MVMAKKTVKSNNMGKTKRSTDDLIDSAIAQQNDWLENRRTFSRGFLKKLNLFARPAPKPAVMAADAGNESVSTPVRHGLRAYWFPILCAIVVIFVAIWVAFIRTATPDRVVIARPVPEPVVQKVNKETVAPTFDIVRIDRDGTIVVAGNWVADKNVSIVINDKIVATERTDKNGDFVYAPSHVFRPGNYTIALVGAEPETKSSDKVFVYISPRGYENSMSLLMSGDGSTILQSPNVSGSDLVVSKIDYLNTGRIVVTGDALPRLRVSLTLDGKYLGFARVSDHKHFGLGADVGELKPGKEYNLQVRLHDGDGKTIAKFEHIFDMPEMTGDEDTFYTVRRGDCLWIIARNFMRRGILFSIIAERNNIKNPDLIFPKQILEIPVGK